jgi:hypothetical protein
MALREYFDCSQLEQSLPLDYKGVIRYHWSNHDLARNFQKENFRINPRSKVRLEQLDIELEKLREEPVWISNNLGQIKLDMHSLYEQFSDPNIRKWMMSVSHMLISTCAQNGPFVPIASMRWFQSDIYRRFVLKRILSGNFPIRDFRLETFLPAQFIFDDYGSSMYMAKMHQITPNGIVLVFSNPMIIQLLKDKRTFGLNLSWGDLLNFKHAGERGLLDEMGQRNLSPVFSGPYKIRLLPSMRPDLIGSESNEHVLFIPFQCIFAQDSMDDGKRLIMANECQNIVNLLRNIKLSVEKTIKIAA